MTRLIDRNTTIPTKKSEIFSTASDSQTSVEVHVLQGERDMASDNRTLGKFHLVGIPPAPRGMPKIEVAFDLDANGILNVSAKDLATQKEQRITISGTGTLTKDDIDRMVKEAEAHSKEDKERREQIETRNTAETRAYQIEKLLEENRDKVAPEDERAVRAAIEEVRKVMADGTKEQIQKALAELDRASHKLAENLYQKAGTGGGPEGSPGPSAEGGPGARGAGGPAGKAPEGDVIDAEYVDVDESKR